MKSNRIDSSTDPTLENLNSIDGQDNPSEKQNLEKPLTTCKRRQLENILEERQLKKDLGDIDDLTSCRGSYYDDDIFGNDYIKLR
jgi:hypothetical protein